MAQITKKYDDMDNTVLSQTGTKKSKCASCKKGQEEVLVDYFSITVRFHPSCELNDRMVSKDKEVVLKTRELIRAMQTEAAEFPLHLLSVSSYQKFINSITGHDREVLEEMSMAELKKLAKSHGIKGRSRKDLVNSLTGK